MVTRGRQVILGIVLLALAAPLYSLARSISNTPPLELLTKFVDSPTVQIIVSPFQPFVYTFSAERIWPELVIWSALAFLVDALLLTTTLALNAQFLETSAASSARAYETLQRIRRGGVMIGIRTKAHFSLPMLPWLGGAGPNLWGQLTTASRSLVKLVGIIVVFLIPVVTILISPSTAVEKEGMTAYFAIGSIMIMAIFTPTMIGFDFRPDIARMEDLKSLPIPSTRLVLGQLLAPVVILCVLEWACIGIIALFTKSNPLVVPSCLAMLFPMNLLFVAVENLYCLWCRFSMSAVKSFLLQMMGRQFVLVIARLLTLTVALAACWVCWRGGVLPHRPSLGTGDRGGLGGDAAHRPRDHAARRPGLRSVRRQPDDPGVTPIAEPCLVLPWERLGGPANMARDEALLECVAEDPAFAALRLYGWSEPTLSLGYFQSIADAETNPRWRGIPLVRRPTGGGALLHDQEVTYAIVLPRDHEVARRTRLLYEQVHAAILELLEESGVLARRRGEGDPRTETKPARPFLCFADRDPEDLVANGAKLAGSAQRRRSGAVLQHGSILIKASQSAPELLGAMDLGMPPVDFLDWANRLVPKILDRLDLLLRPAAWPEHVIQRADNIERSVYRARLLDAEAAEAIRDRVARPRQPDGRKKVLLRIG